MTGRVHIQEAFKLALSLVLFYWLALWMNWDLPKYGGLAIVLVSLGTTGASLHKGLLRIVGTTVGAAVGLLALALFAQDRWFMMLFLCAYLVIIGYGMQGSRYAYAWFVAGFMPPLVWATTYGDVENAFHYAVFRYLETTTGIIIYTVVCIIFWPRRAGDDLDRQGAEFWPGLRRIFGDYRRELETGEASAETDALRSKLEGGAAQMLATLQAAFADTASVALRKRPWKTLPVNLRAFGAGLELWHDGFDDVRRLGLSRLLPGLAQALDTIDRRLDRVAQLWQARAAGAEPALASGDQDLLAPVALHPDRDGAVALSHFDRAALLSFEQQLRTLDATSRALLRTMRDLAGLDTEREGESDSIPASVFRPSRWDPARLVRAGFPPLCFAVAYLFWIVADPPTGPSVPNMASVFGLLLLLTPMKPMVFVTILIAMTWIVVAPIYFFVMPRLDTGTGLLALIFVYSFLFSLVGVRAPALKVTALAMFVMMTGISNDQVYSFLGLVNGGMMMVLGMSVVAVVQMVLSPVRPEHELLNDIRRFFRGCNGVLRSRHAGLRHYVSVVMPVPRRMHAIAKKIAYEDFPDNDQEKVNRLLAAVHSLSLRIQALGMANERVASHAVSWSGSLVTTADQLRSRLERIFDRWSRLEHNDAIDERDAFLELGRGLEAQLETLTREQPGRLDDSVLRDLYAMLGCARGLVHAVAETQTVMNEINWDQWAEARF